MAINALAENESTSDDFFFEVGENILDGIFPVSETKKLVRINGADELATGNVQDGYIGATVFSDENRNGILEEGESWTTTDETGNFELKVDYNTTAPLVTIGGTDISTNQPFRSSLTAPSGSRIVSPLTTLVESLVANELNDLTEKIDLYGEQYKQLVSSAEQQVIQALGLPDQANLDPQHRLYPGC